MKKSGEVCDVLDLFQKLDVNNVVHRDYVCGVIDALEWVLEFKEDNDINQFLKIIEIRKREVKKE